MSSMDLIELTMELHRKDKENETLRNKVSRYETLLDLKEVNTEYKDRLFKFIFGNPENRQWTLELYNAINETSYTDPELIQFNTIGDFLYMKMRNDISFVISFEMNLWEHQSTFNPNMPLRFLRYGTKLYEKYIAASDYYEYSSTLQKIPRPRCICFYNGTKEQPEKRILRLSDAYDGEGDIEVTVTMLNINYGKNQKLMEVCKPLQEYAWFVDAVRRNQKETKELATAIDNAIAEMPEDFIIKPFLIANRAEVKSVLFTEYNEDKIMEREREEGKREGRAEERLTLLWDLVADQVLTMEDAARRAGMTVSKFQESHVAILAEPAQEVYHASED